MSSTSVQTHFSLLHRKCRFIIMVQSIQDLAREWTAAQPGVAIFISSLIPDLHDAQDVLQDVAATVFASACEKTAPPHSLRPGAIGFARHKALDFYRRRSSRHRALPFD